MLVLDTLLCVLESAKEKKMKAPIKKKSVTKKPPDYKYADISICYNTSNLNVVQEL